MKVFNAIDVNHDKFLDKKALCPEYPVEFVFFRFVCFTLVGRGWLCFDLAPRRKWSQWSRPRVRVVPTTISVWC